MSLDFLRRNPGLKILSIILALCMWAYVRYQSTPRAVLSSQVKIRVPIISENVGENLVVLDAPEAVTVTVQGVPETLAQLKPGHFKAAIDLSQKKAGNHTVSVKITTPPDVESSKPEPESVQVRLDPLVKRLFTVKVKPQGTIASGFMLGKMSCQPENVTVAGGQTHLSQIKEVRAVGDVDGADMDQIQRLAVEIVDENEKVIEDLKAEPAFVRATISIKPEIISTAVSIAAQITGEPGEGFKIENITITPPKINVSYRYDLESPPKIIQTEKIDIEGLKTSMAKDVELITPDEVTMDPQEKVRVHIMIAPNIQPSP